MNVRKGWLSTLASLLLLSISLELCAAPQIETWVSSKGTPVLFVSAPDLPMLDVRITFQAGSDRDRGQWGLASLTAGLLDQGAGDWNADLIADRLARVGAELSIDAQRDMASVSLRTLTRQAALRQAVETVALVIAKPTFAQEDIGRVRANVITGLNRDDQDPGTIGQKAIYQLIFGDHPYATDPAGTLDTLSSLVRQGLVNFHSKYYVTRNAVIAMVGDLSRSQAEELAEILTQDLAEGEKALPVPPVPDLTTSTTRQISFPSSQTHVYIGQAGMKRTDPDYFPLYVGNHILGGSGLVSLLMDEVREKRGLSYSVYSYFLPLSERGPFLASLSTKNDQARLAREVLMATIERFRTQGPSQTELVAAIQNITGGFPLRIAGNGKIAQYLAMIGFYELPLDYLDKFKEKVSAVTAEAIRDAFQRRIDPQHFATVVVGPEVVAGAEAELGPLPFQGQVSAMPAVK